MDQKENRKVKKIKYIILIFILVQLIFYLTYICIKRYQNYHYWEEKTDFLSIDYSSENQICNINMN